MQFVSASDFFSVYFRSPCIYFSLKVPLEGLSSYSIRRIFQCSAPASCLHLLVHLNLFNCLVLSVNSVLVNCSYYSKHNSLHRHQLIHVCRLLVIVFVVTRVPHPSSNTDLTSQLNILSLVLVCPTIKCLIHLAFDFLCGPEEQYHQRSPDPQAVFCLSASAEFIYSRICCCIHNPIYSQ